MKMYNQQKCLIYFYFLSVVITCGVIIYMVNKRTVFQQRTPFVPPLKIELVHLQGVDNNNSCHYVQEGDVVQAAEDRGFHPAPNSIYFHETSCRGGLNSRQACAVESAARANIDSTVYVLFCSPVTEYMYYRTNIAMLRQYPNIKIARVHVTEYAKNTPLEEMFASDPFKKSKYRVEHTADILRFLTLYKWGGIYLDMDMLVVRSFAPLGYNWMAREDAGFMNTAIAAIAQDDVGKMLINAILNELKTTYRPDLWSHNGPGALTRVYFKLCNATKLEDFNRTVCQGAHVYSPEYFYPVHYTIKDDYFKAGAELKNVDKAYTHHFWNKLTHAMKTEKNSPYDKLAKWFCPSIYEMYGDEFGN